MLPIVVVPALDEERTLEATCLSLGFCSGRLPNEGLLIIVDNGSTDGTAAIALRIRDASPPGRVLLVREDERGYVSARAAGIRTAAIAAAEAGYRPDATLVLQADADTIYEDGYVDAMVASALRLGRGYLYEGSSIPPAKQDDPCRRFRDLEQAVDDTFPMVPDEMDVIVDDKVAAYVLADYEAWGGHRRDYSPDASGDEFLAETTRLFLRARMGHAVRRTRVDAALATTSSRRILEDPALAFATAGFPRERGWRVRWQASYRGPRSLEAFDPSNASALDEAIAMRIGHLSAQFRHLPEQLERRLAWGRYEKGQGAFSAEVVPLMLSNALGAAGIL